MKVKNILAKNGINIPQILIPNKDISLEDWSVIACDQYTQDREYWDSINQKLKNTYSTLHLIYPEVYLEDSDKNERINSIKQNMQSYIENTKLFQKPIEGFIYIERKTNYCRTRKGLVVAVDLETYEWEPGSKALIRATEATILDRIPPRMEIRKNAPLELPHIMLLCNDPEKIFIESIKDLIKNQEPTYNTKLMCESGSITGWSIVNPRDLEKTALNLEKLANKSIQKDGTKFLFAVGDGNHSLATAKATWDAYKEQNKDICTEHPARYALVEIVNLYDEGLTFEPIHRVLFNTDINKLSEWLAKELGGELKAISTKENLEELITEPGKSRFGFVSKSNYIMLESSSSILAVSRLQPALDKFIEENSNVKIDYIHGSDEVFRLGNQENTVSIMLPLIEKNFFFNSISDEGPLPRKSFSMGEASEKRFYIECRKLFC